MESFTYERDTFFVEVSGHNRHRRATIYEIQEILHPSFPQSNKDPAGHWYEAQCIHYGLRPSKTKSVAKTRLLDALNEKSLKVPEIIHQTEARLRKEWHKDAKEKLKSQRGASELPNAENFSRKRKATAVSEESGPKRKKMTIKKEEHQESTALHNVSPIRPSRPVQTARRGRANTARTKSEKGKTVFKQDDNVNIHINTSFVWHDASQSEDASGRPKRPKQTARCNRGGTVQRVIARTDTRVAQRKTERQRQPQPQSRKQTARRSAPHIGRVRGNATSSTRGGQSCYPKNDQQPAISSRGAYRSTQATRRSRGWHFRAGQTLGHNAASSRSGNTRNAAGGHEDYGMHGYFECEAYANEDFSNERYANGEYSDSGYHYDGYQSESYPHDDYSNEEYLNERYSNGNLSDEEYGFDISGPDEDDYPYF